MILYFCKLILLYLLLHSNEKEKYKSKINNAHLKAKRSIVIAKLEKSTSDLLCQLHNKTDTKLSKIIKFDHLTEEQYMVNKDNAKIKARKCETYVKQLEVLLYCEKEKLTIAKYQKQWVSDQLQAYMQMLCDVKYVLTQHSDSCNCK